MKKIFVKNTCEIASSDTEAILWGGYQIPSIRYTNNALYVKFMGRKDFVENIGNEDCDPVYVSHDYGVSWERRDLSSWRQAATLLPNGDRIDFVQRKNICGSFHLPETQNIGFGNGSGNSVTVYLIDEICNLVDGVEKTFTMARIKAGETEPVEEICNVNWKDMTVTCYKKGAEVMLRNINPEQCDIKIDKNGVLWLPVYANAVSPDRQSDGYLSTHLLNSSDMGHTWNYVSSVYYDPELNDSNAYSVEGFNEATLEILDNGDFLMIMRSGSIHPLEQNGRPIPKMFIVRSSDQGKNWSKPQVLFDYGIHPHSIRTVDGTYLMISGRPGVYLRTFDDSENKWSEIFEIVSVPEEDIMTKYYEYTCSNADICITDDGRIFVAYSKFLNNSDTGEHKKSIMVSEICFED